MKLSVSVPDDLWRKVAGPDDSPSEVVQAALTELARRRHPTGPSAYAPRAEVVEATKPAIKRAVQRLLDERRELREAGYRAGVELCGENLFEAEWFRVMVMMATPEELLREWMALTEGPIHERIMNLAREHAAIDFHFDPVATLPQEFLTGMVAAFFDIWDRVEAASNVKERA